MQKLLELIDQLRFAELKKIDKLSNAQEAYLKQCGVHKDGSSN